MFIQLKIAYYQQNRVLVLNRFDFTVVSCIWELAALAITVIPETKFFLLGTTIACTQVIMDLFTFTTEILNGKFVFTAMNILVHEMSPNFTSNIK